MAPRSARSAADKPERQRRTAVLKRLPEAALAEAVGRMPLDHYVIWNGVACPGRKGSIRSQALGLVDEVWRPVPLRTLVIRAARLAGVLGLDPDAVRNAVRMHQSARSAAYFLVRRTSAGDFVAVVDVPTPSGRSTRLNAGDIVLSRTGVRFDGILEVRPKSAA